MKIREKILEGHKERLRKLRECKAPQIMINTLENKINQNEIEVDDPEKLLDTEIITWERLKGRGGKIYIKINGDILYFPNGKCGAFIKHERGN